jgi:hypothetical protein
VLGAEPVLACPPSAPEPWSINDSVSASLLACAVLVGFARGAWSVVIASGVTTCTAKFDTGTGLAGPNVWVGKELMTSSGTPRLRQPRGGSRNVGTMGRHAVVKVMKQAGGYGCKSHEGQHASQTVQ